MVDISVVIPTFNRRDYLEAAVSSCLEQRGVEMEIIVVDDGSEDDTQDFLKSIDHACVRPFFQEHEGGQAARNRGLQEARGRYIKFLDDDDWLAEGTLEAEVSALEQSGKDLTFGGYVVVDSSGGNREVVDPPRGNDFAALLFEGTQLVIPLNLTYRRALVQDLEWDPSLPCRQDYAFALEVALEEPTVVRLDRITGFKREHQQESVSGQAAQVGQTAHVHGRILLEAARGLYENGQLAAARRSSVLNGLWSWAHVVASDDMKAFRTIYSFIEEIEPSFRPPRSSYVLKIMDSVAGPATTERMLHPIRAAKSW
jgi:hypothetical protein